MACGSAYAEFRNSGWQIELRSEYFGSALCWVLAESHLNYCKIKFPYFLSRQKASAQRQLTHTQIHTLRHMRVAYKAWRYAYPFHMLRLPGKEHRPVKLVPALGMRLGVEGCSSSPSIGPIYHNKRTKETHLGLANVSVSIWLLKSQKWPPVCPPLPASVQWVVHGIINCKRTPVCLYNGGNCAATATALGVEPQPRHRSSLVDASPMGFSFTASAKGVCQCRVESSQSQNQSQSQSQSRVGALCAGLHWNWMPFVFN